MRNGPPPENNGNLPLDQPPISFEPKWEPSELAQELGEGILFDDYLAQDEQNELEDYSNKTVLEQGEKGRAIRMAGTENNDTSSHKFAGEDPNFPRGIPIKIKGVETDFVLHDAPLSENSFKYFMDAIFDSGVEKVVAIGQSIPVSSKRFNQKKDDFLNYFLSNISTELRYEITRSEFDNKNELFDKCVINETLDSFDIKKNFTGNVEYRNILTQEKKAVNISLYPVKDGKPIKFDKCEVITSNQFLQDFHDCVERSNRDRKILIHCKGSKGRSGAWLFMFFLFLLRDKIFVPEDVGQTQNNAKALLEALRENLPHLVTTQQQYCYAVAQVAELYKQCPKGIEPQSKIANAIAEKLFPILPKITDPVPPPPSVLSNNPFTQFQQSGHKRPDTQFPNAMSLTTKA